VLPNVWALVQSLWRSLKSKKRWVVDKSLLHTERGLPSHKGATSDCSHSSSEGSDPGYKLPAMALPHGGRIPDQRVETLAYFLSDTVLILYPPATDVTVKYSCAFRTAQNYSSIWHMPNSVSRGAYQFELNSLKVWKFLYNKYIPAEPPKIVTYTRWVVWLITRRGFGLDTGFILYGDLNLHTLQLLRTS
jgi:hypothetical protein